MSCQSIAFTGAPIFRPRYSPSTLFWNSFSGRSSTVWHMLLT